MQQLNIIIFLGVYNTHINRIQENQVTGQEHSTGSKSDKFNMRK